MYLYKTNFSNCSLGEKYSEETNYILNLQSSSTVTVQRQMLVVWFIFPSSGRMVEYPDKKRKTVIVILLSHNLLAFNNFNMKNYEVLKKKTCSP